METGNNLKIIVELEMASKYNGQLNCIVVFKRQSNLLFRRKDDMEKILLLEESQPVERSEEDDHEEDVGQVSARVHQQLGQRERIDGELAGSPGPGPGIKLALVYFNDPWVNILSIMVVIDLLFLQMTL
jgi:hypothetical protein